jgi:hypothetical protein
MTMEAIHSSKISVDFYRTTRRQIPEDRLCTALLFTTNITLMFFSLSKVNVSTNTTSGWYSVWLQRRGIGVRFPAGARDFSVVQCSDRRWDPPTYCSSGYRGLFHQGVKWPGREVYHSLLRLIRRSIFHSPICFHCAVLNDTQRQPNIYCSMPGNLNRWVSGRCPSCIWQKLTFRKLDTFAPSGLKVGRNPFKWVH